VITAVLAEKRSVTEEARRYGVSRSWIYELLARHRIEGDTDFESRSRRPHTSRGPPRRPRPSWRCARAGSGPAQVMTPGRPPSPGTCPSADRPDHPWANEKPGPADHGSGLSPIS